jgi:hypothetical protein
MKDSLLNLRIPLVRGLATTILPWSLIIITEDMESLAKRLRKEVKLNILFLHFSQF